MLTLRQEKLALLRQLGFQFALQFTNSFQVWRKLEEGILFLM